MNLWKTMIASAALVGVACGLARAGDEAPAERLSLLPGDMAPAFAPTHWVKGEGVSGFEKGQVYVVDFWATWCGPCIMAMPHLTEVQKQHPESVTVVAMNIWEHGVEGDERVAKVTDKVESLGEKMGVRVAIDGTKAMENSWMRASGAQGIPTTFIIDQAGRVAWIGHPMRMDEPLSQVLDGTFDVPAYRAEYKSAMEREVKIAQIWDLYRKGEYDAFQKAARESYELMADDAGQLNGLAWEITTNESIKDRDLDLAYKAAKAACEMTDWEDAFVIDTYAHVLFARGDAAGAAKWEQKAIDLLPVGANEEVEKNMREALARFRAKG